MFILTLLPALSNYAIPDSRFKKYKVNWILQVPGIGFPKYRYLNQIREKRKLIINTMF